jgi:hypothetical protein
MSLNHVISILQILVWFSSPLLVLQQGDIYAAHPSVEEIADGIATNKALQSIQVQTLEQIDAKVFESFLALHANQPTEDEPGHYHTSFDGCCGLGGVVCDASMVSTLRPSQDCCTGERVDWGNFLYAGIDVPTLRHPPKQYSSFNPTELFEPHGSEAIEWANGPYGGNHDIP